MAVRRGIAAALESLSQSLLRRRQLQEEKQQRAENLTMGLGPQLAQLGSTYSQGGYSPEQASSILAMLTQPLEAAGAKVPNFNLQSFAPSADTIAGPVRESLTPDTTTEQIVSGLNRRPGGQRLTTPAFGETPMAPGGGIPGAKQFGPVQNPEVAKLEREVGVLGQQEERAAQRGFERSERHKEAAFPGELRRAGAVGRQAEETKLGFQPFYDKLELDRARQLATDPAIQKAEIDKQVAIAREVQRLEQEHGPLQRENITLAEDTPFTDPATGEETVIPAGTEAVVFFDYKGDIVGFVPGTPSWKPATPRSLTPGQQAIDDAIANAFRNGGVNMSSRPGANAPATPPSGLAPEEAEALRQEMRRRGLIP